MSKKVANVGVSSRSMHALETNAEYYGISLMQLMENAGRSVACEIARRFESGKKVVLFCGLGGNGGDGFVAARHLLSLGFQVTVLLAGRSRDIFHESAKANFASLKFLNKIPIFELNDSSEIPKIDADVVVDALLGTGTKGKLKPPILQCVEKINQLPGFKLAVDIPTGVDSDTGENLGLSVKADATLTFHSTKTGLAKAKRSVGELIVANIGLPRQLEFLAGPGDVQLVSKKRAPTAHKGDFGRVLAIGGSEVFSGAPTLVSLAALRTGADIVYLAAPAKTAVAISSISPDLITVKLDGGHLNPGNMADLKPYIESVDSVVLGPGLGMHTETKQFVKMCIKAVEGARKPLLLDADGLKAFADFKHPIKVPAVLTPHAGEYSILTNQKLPEDIDERAAMVQETAGELNCTILLKGKVDIVGSKQLFKLNLTGNPGMTVGGTGDVLSGIIGALLAQKNDPFDAAVAGAFVNGAAGDFAANKVGHHMIASDLIGYIPQVLDDPMSHIEVRHWSG